MNSELRQYLTYWLITYGTGWVDYSSLEKEPYMVGTYMHSWLHQRGWIDIGNEHEVHTYSHHRYKLTDKAIQHLNEKE